MFRFLSEIDLENEIFGCCVQIWVQHLHGNIIVFCFVNFHMFQCQIHYGDDQEVLRIKILLTWSVLREFNDVSLTGRSKRQRFDLCTLNRHKKEKKVMLLSSFH